MGAATDFYIGVKALQPLDDKAGGVSLNDYVSEPEITNLVGTKLEEHIGGFTIGPTELFTGAKKLYNDTEAGIHFGIDGIGIGNNVFTVSSAGALVATSATITGAITATSGSIGSFTIGTYLYTGTKTAWNDANAGVHVGSDGIGIGNNVFTVNGSTGALVATSATISGAITATSGTIGSFTIGTYLYTGTKTAYNDANAGVHIGSDGIGIGNNVFTVSSAGALVATSATITGAITATSGAIGSFTIGTYLYTGTKTAWNDANAGVHIGSDGIGIANNVFTVSSAGALVATSATITGTITATAGQIGGFDIGADYVRDAGNSFGMASTVTGGDDVRGWAGATFANRATAPLRWTEAGAFTATSAAITGSFKGNITLEADGATYFLFRKTGDTYNTATFSATSNATPANSATSWALINPSTDVTMGFVLLNSGGLYTDRRVFPEGQLSRYLGDDGFKLNLSVTKMLDNLYPGNQTTRYISDDGTYTTVSGGLKLGASLYPGNQTTHYISGSAPGIGIDCAAGTDLFEAAGNIRLQVSSAVDRGYTIARTGTGAAVWTMYSPSNSTNLQFYSGAVVLTLTTTGLLYSYPTTNNWAYLADDGTHSGGVYVDSSGSGAVGFGSKSNHSIGFFTNNGAYQMVITAGGGVTVGSPTGGDKGAGTINAVAVYRNGTALDRVFEPGYKMLAVSEMRDYYERNYCLPTLQTRNIHDAGSINMGSLTDGLWETAEVHARYIAELEARVAELEARLS